MTARYNHISPDALPDEWTRSLGLKPGQQVSVTIELEKDATSFNRAAVENILDEFAELPVLDERNVDEIIGYDDNGLPA